MIDSNRVNSTLSRVIRNQRSHHSLLEGLRRQVDRNHKTYESRFDSLDLCAADNRNRFGNFSERFDYLDKLHDDAKGDRTQKCATIASVLQVVFLIAIIVLLSVQLYYMNQLFSSLSE